MGQPAPLGVSASGLPPAGDRANAVLAGVFTAIGPSQPFAFRGPMNLEIYASLIDALTTTAGLLTSAVASGAGLGAGASVESFLVPNGTVLAGIAGTVATLLTPPITLYGTVNAASPGAAGVISGLYQTNGLLGALVTGPNIPAGTIVTAIITPFVSDGTFPIRGNKQLGSVAISDAPTGLSATPGPVAFTFLQTGNAIVASGTDAAAVFTGSGIGYNGSVQLERSFNGGKRWIVCNVGGSGLMAIYAAGTPVSLTFGEPEREVLYRLNCTAYTSGIINYRISQTGAAAESLAIGQLT